MKDLTKIYIDLSKCTEEQRKHLFSLLPEPEYDHQYLINHDNFMLHFLQSTWWVFNYGSKNKQELTYPEFIKLFEEPKKLPSELLKEYFKNTPREQVLKDWESTAYLDNTNSPKIRELFERREGENNTYSFSYLACGKTLTAHIEAKNFNKAMIKFATNYHDIEWLYHAKKL